MKSIDILRILRKAGFKGERLHKAAGLPSSRISKIENKDKNARASFDMAKSASNALKMSVDELERAIEVMKEEDDKGQCELDLDE